MNISENEKNLLRKVGSPKDQEEKKSKEHKWVESKKEDRLKDWFQSLKPESVINEEKELREQEKRSQIKELFKDKRIPEEVVANREQKTEALKKTSGLKEKVKNTGKAALKFFDKLVNAQKYESNTINGLNGPIEIKEGIRFYDNKNKIKGSKEHIVYTVKERIKNRGKDAVIFKGSNGELSIKTLDEIESLIQSENLGQLL